MSLRQGRHQRRPYKVITGRGRNAARLKLCPFPVSSPRWHNQDLFTQQSAVLDSLSNLSHDYTELINI